MRPVPSKINAWRVPISPEHLASSGSLAQKRAHSSDLKPWYTWLVLVYGYWCTWCMCWHDAQLDSLKPAGDCVHTFTYVYRVESIRIYESVYTET